MSDVKKINADNWGRTSENYAQRAHKGPGMMMPLIARYTEAANTLISTSSPKCIDIASGAGEPGISLAKQYPNGTALMTDIAPGMVKQAVKQTAEAGVENTSFDVADAEDLGAYADGTFDVLTCNCGLMFMPHYSKALSEFQRVLKPGGIAIFSVWGPKDKTDLIGMMHEVREAVAPGTAFFADPAVLGDQGELHAAVEQVGFSSFDIREINVPMRFPGTVDSVRSVLDNAVVSELFNRLQAEGDTDIYKEAENAWMAALMKHGYMKGNEMVFPQNIALMVTAKK